MCVSTAARAALALYHYKGSEADGELSFQAGDTIEIISRGSPDDPDFWEGRCVAGARVDGLPWGVL